LSFRFSAAQRKLSYLICCSSGIAWLMLFNVWNPSLTTVVLILSFVTTTGFSMTTGTFLLPLLIVPSARLFALRQSNGFLCGPFRLIHNRLVNGYRLRVLGDAYTSLLLMLTATDLPKFSILPAPHRSKPFDPNQPPDS
jgi:hypothetical protein